MYVIQIPTLTISGLLCGTAFSCAVLILTSWILDCLEVPVCNKAFAWFIALWGVGWLVSIIVLSAYVEIRI